MKSVNRITELLNKKDRGLLSVYFTAGYPALDSVRDIILALQEGGVDMIEIGVPFSDPMADGKVIQESSSRALANGMSLGFLLDCLEGIRPQCSLPLLLMGYLNPMMQYGTERLFERCVQIGIDALIIPDLPFNEYMKGYKKYCEKYDIPVIMLITPETPEGRIRLIDDNCGGFIYMVSSASTTGTRGKFTAEQLAYFKRIDKMCLNNKRLIGFGISGRETLSAAFSASNGAIVGSLFIECLSRASSVNEAVSLLKERLNA